MVRIELTTYGLRNRCSTTELHWRAEGGVGGSLNVRKRRETGQRRALQVYTL